LQASEDLHHLSVNKSGDMLLKKTQACENTRASIVSQREQNPEEFSNSFPDTRIDLARPSDYTQRITNSLVEPTTLEFPTRKISNPITRSDVCGTKEIQSDKYIDFRKGGCLRTSAPFGANNPTLPNTISISRDSDTWDRSNIKDIVEGTNVAIAVSGHVYVDQVGIDNKTSDLDLRTLRDLVDSAGISKEQHNDDSLRENYTLIEKSLLNKVDCVYFLNDKGILFHRGPGPQCMETSGLVLPSKCRPPIVKLAHEMGHFGAKKTWTRLRHLFCVAWDKKQYFCLLQIV